MKNYLFTSLKNSTRGIFALLGLLFLGSSLSAQLVVTITSPMDGDCHCVELMDDVTFSASVTDGGVAIPPSNLMWAWSGPNGFSSTLPSPVVTMNDVNQTGTYSVVVETISGLMESATVDISVKPLIDVTCPSDLTVTPDLTTGAMCIKNLEDYSFTVGALATCIGAPNLDYCVRFINEDASVETAETGTGPATGNITAAGNYPLVALDYYDLDFGIHEIFVDIKDRADQSILTQCITTVRVLESINNVACNDEVNLTLTNDCQATITPDMILQGDYCFDNFQISMEDLNGDLVGPADDIMLTAPGTYTISVTNLSGISCWGTVLAEDKSVPQVDCQDDVTMYCAQSAFIPGTSICGYGKYTFSGAVAAGTPTTVALNLATGAPVPSGTVKEAWLNISGEITDLSDLVLTLTSPGAPGTSVEITNLNSPGTGVVPCTNPNINVCLADDTSYKPYMDFFNSDECNSQVNAYIGNFQPANAFSGFNGATAGAGWTMDVSSSVGFTDVTFELIVLTNEGDLVTSSSIMQNQGCGTSDISITFEDELLSDNCANGNWEVVERTWTADNNTTELSNTCSQMITFIPFTLDDIIWPKSMDGVHSEVLDCSLLFDDNWNLNPAVVDEDGIPLPALTGSPTIPFGEMCGNFQVTSEDLVFDLCGQYSKKIIRKWAVLDWCTSDFAEYDQVIKIEDTDPIVMTCRPDSDQGIVVNDSEGNPILDSNGAPLLHWPGVTDGSQCAGSWDIEPPLVIQNACDAHEFDFTVEFLIADENGEAPFDGEFVSSNPATGTQVIGTLNPTRIENLPLGVTWLKYSVEDECGNTGVCFTEVAIVDESRPTPVCIENTVVAIGDDGCAYLPAESIDNGSWDNCGVVHREISRSQNSGYTDVLSYCCGCVMNDETVYLRVTDAAGNSNVCVVFVEVQNNTEPSVSGGPTGETRSCTAGAFDLFAISEAGKQTFTYDANCPNNPAFDPNTNVVATVAGNVVQAGDTFEPGECGIGSVTIKYEVMDPCGGVIGSAVNQQLSYTNDFSGFDVTRWPQDYTIPNCVNGTEPENLPANNNASYIQTTASSCGSNTAISYDDQVFPDVVDACYKILRTWTVIDWCIVNAPGNTVDDGKRTYTQLIKVNDSSAPVIANLTDVFGNDPSCMHTLTEDDVSYEITDNCTPAEDIVISFKVDGNPVSNIFGQTYSNGTTITIEAADHCDNVNTFSFMINTTDTEPPSPYCDASVVTVVNESGQAEIWVSDFSISATDNCDNDVDDYFLNDEGFQTQVLTFDCGDIPNGIAELIGVTVYFEDDSGNINTCNVSVIVQDNIDVCPDQPGSRIAGTIHTEEDKMVENVMVELMQGNSMMNQSLTLDGDYAFNALDDSEDYMVVPHKDDNYLNGVSTIDLVMIQRHILGLERFTSPYKVIAADTDNSGTINGVDLVELRKLILGITVELPHGQQSWRLPVKGQQFANPMAPFPYEETIELNNLTGDMLGQDFIAVKIGDVNGSSLVSFKDTEVSTRSSKSLNLEIEDVTLERGATVTIPVYATNMDAIVGLQSTLSFNPSVLQYNGVAAGDLEVSEGNLGLYSVDKGYVTFSWNNVNGVSVEADRALFELEFQVMEEGQLSEQLFLSSTMTSSEAYTDDMETIELNLGFKGADLATDFVLYQNIPNPFADNTEIRFSLPAMSDVTLSVYDVNGTEILRKTNNYDGGSHSILLNSNELPSSGVMYYKLETAHGTASRKMIQIR